jgi:hypothetical protein
VKNDKVTVINGLSRGGTNIIWNLMQSHPDVCSPIYETGEVLLKYGSINGRAPLRSFLAGPLARAWPVSRMVQKGVDSRLYRFKMSTLEHDSNRYRTEDELYDPQSVAASMLCLKSTDKDIKFSRLFSQMWPDPYFITLMRNGYAVCEGWMRRGASAQKVGRFYRWFGEQVIRDSDLYPNYKVVKFEDMMQAPFDTAFDLFKFTGLEPSELPKLRLKAKRVLSDGGDHETRFGDENSKYWFDREEISQMIDPTSSETQSTALSDEDRSAFEREAGPVLEHFGYA